MSDGTILMKLIDGEKVTDEDIENALYEICDSVHASCSDECPVYKLNHNKCVGADKPFEQNRGCDCFKNGRKMLAFLLKQTEK